MSKRVLIAQIMHETNTFSLLPTDEDSYRRRYLGIGDEIVGQFRGTRTELGGFIDAAERFGWTTVNAVAANATPSGKVTAACWTLLKGAVLDALDKQGPVDGICLALHGAMVTETEDDAEGALLEALRRRLGPRVPIAVTLDLHANVSDAMAENANAIIAYRTYPHIDQFERAAQAADLVNEMMEGRLELSCIVARPPSLDGCDHGRTSAGVGPMVDLLARAAEYEKETGIHAISIHAGFQWSDIHMAGPSVSISHNPAVTRRAKDILDMLVREIWDTRDKQTVHYQTLEVAVAEALKGEDGTGKPLVIADPTDNPGGGCYGDPKKRPVDKVVEDVKLSWQNLITARDRVALLENAAAIAGEVGILLTVLLHDLWTFAGRAARSTTDRVRRLLGVQLALGVLLFGRLAVINGLVNWFHLGPMAAFLIALAAVMPVSHLLGSRLTWRGARS